MSAMHELPRLRGELHLHLEGTLPATGETPKNFAEFLQCYIRDFRSLQTPEAYAKQMRLVIAAAAAELEYLEVNLSVGAMLYVGSPADELIDAALGVAEESALPVRFILDAVRQFGPEAAGPVLELARRFASRGVVAVGVGGDEAAMPARLFSGVARATREAGLAWCPHAGETTNADDVWAMLDMGAARIGHGIRSVDDPVLLAELRRSQVPLEISLTSNVITGSVPGYEQHPLRTLVEAGVPVTLNTDDPGIFRTNLRQEFAIAHWRCGLTIEQLRVMADNALRYGFDSPAK
jgi:aminodeoxyfutalosine deaminase